MIPSLAPVPGSDRYARLAELPGQSPAVHIELLRHDGERSARAEWTKSQIVDALVVLTNVETFDSLSRHRARSWEQIADTLWTMSAAFLEASVERSTTLRVRVGPGPWPGSAGER